MDTAYTNNQLAELLIDKLGLDLTKRHLGNMVRDLLDHGEKGWWLKRLDEARALAEVLGQDWDDFQAEYLASNDREDHLAHPLLPSFGSVAQGRWDALLVPLPASVLDPKRGSRHWVQLPVGLRARWMKSLATDRGWTWLSGGRTPKKGVVAISVKQGMEPEFVLPEMGRGFALVVVAPGPIPGLPDGWTVHPNTDNFRQQQAANMALEELGETAPSQEELDALFGAHPDTQLDEFLLWLEYRGRRWQDLVCVLDAQLDPKLLEAMEGAALDGGYGALCPREDWEALVPSKATDLARLLRRASQHLAKKIPQPAKARSVLNRSPAVLVDSLIKAGLLQESFKDSGRYRWWPSWFAHRLQHAVLSEQETEPARIGAALLLTDERAESAFARLLEDGRSGVWSDLNACLSLDVSGGEMNSIAAIDGACLAVGHLLLDGTVVSKRVLKLTGSRLAEVRGQTWRRLLAQGQGALSSTSCFMGELAILLRSEDAPGLEVMQRQLQFGNEFAKLEASVGDWLESEPPRLDLCRRAWSLTIELLRRNLGSADWLNGEAWLPARLWIKMWHPDPARQILSVAEEFDCIPEQLQLETARQGRTALGEPAFETRALNTVWLFISQLFAFYEELQAVFALHGVENGRMAKVLWVRWGSDLVSDPLPVSCIGSSPELARLLWAQAPDGLSPMFWKGAENRARETLWTVFTDHTWRVWGRSYRDTPSGWLAMPKRPFRQLSSIDKLAKLGSVPPALLSALWARSPREAVYTILSKLLDLGQSELRLALLNAAPPSQSAGVLRNIESLPPTWLQRVVDERHSGWKDAWARLAAAV